MKVSWSIPNVLLIGIIFNVRDFSWGWVSAPGYNVASVPVDGGSFRGPVKGA